MTIEALTRNIARFSKRFNCDAHTNDDGVYVVTGDNVPAFVAWLKLHTATLGIIIDRDYADRANYVSFRVNDDVLCN
jgi:hypothetical protein